MAGQLERRPLLLVGMPRSGTTWSMRVLAADPALFPLMEPDNEVRSAPAIWAKRRTGRFPVLEPGDQNREYRWLWSWAMDGAPAGWRLEATRHLLRAVRTSELQRYYQDRFAPLMRVAGVAGARPGGRAVPELTTRRLLVKTVYLPLAVDWVASEFDVDVLVLRRHPGSVLASWISMDLNDRHIRLEEDPRVRRLVQGAGVPLPGPDPLEHLIWQIGVLNLALDQAVERNPSFIVRTHEELCTDPVAEFRRLYDDLGLDWSPKAEEYLASNNRPGVGFPTQRVASDQPDAWKSKLDPHQIEVMRRTLAPFPLTTWTERDLAP